MQTALSQGAVVQVTAGVISGQMNDKNMSRCVNNLFKLGLVHLVASDAHTPSHTMPGEVVEAVIAQVGEARARQIFEDNPRAVIEGASMPPQHSVTPTTSQGGGFWSRLRGK